MTIDKKIIAIIVLSILVLVFGWIAFKPAPKPTDTKFIEEQIKKLDSANAQLGKEIQLERTKNAFFQGQIDSLSKLEPIIITKYVTKYHSIDKLPSGGLINEFDSIFKVNSLNKLP